MGYLLPLALKQIHEQFGPQFVVFTGDQVDDGFSKYGKADLEQVKAVAEKNAGGPVHFAYGNHDGPQDQWARMHGPLDYSFDVGDVRCVVLNTGSMEPEKEQESSLKALECLQTALRDAGPKRVIVLAHQWIYPTDVEGYSIVRAEAVLAAVEADPRVVAVINGHYHSGKYSEKSGVHYCTAKAFCEPPLCYSTYELTPTELVWTEYKLSSQAKAFVAGETRRLKLRE
jgi:predicted phosphodiesterase